MAEEERTGLSLFDGVLIIGGGVIALFVAFALLSFVAGIIWFAVKVIVVVALVALVAKLAVPPPLLTGGRPEAQAVIDSNSSMCSATMRLVEK